MDRLLHRVAMLASLQCKILPIFSRTHLAHHELEIVVMIVIISTRFQLAVSAPKLAEDSICCCQDAGTC